MTGLSVTIGFFVGAAIGGMTIGTLMGKKYRRMEEDYHSISREAETAIRSRGAAIHELTTKNQTLEKTLSEVTERARKNYESMKDRLSKMESKIAKTEQDLNQATQDTTNLMEEYSKMVQEKTELLEQVKQANSLLNQYQAGLENCQQTTDKLFSERQLFISQIETLSSSLQEAINQANIFGQRVELLEGVINGRGETGMGAGGAALRGDTVPKSRLAAMFTGSASFGSAQDRTLTNHQPQL